MCWWHRKVKSFTDHFSFSDVKPSYQIHLDRTNAIWKVIGLPEYDRKFINYFPYICFQLCTVLVMVFSQDLLALVTYISFVDRLIELTCILGLLWLRYKQPERSRPIKVSQRSWRIMFVAWIYTSTKDHTSPTHTQTKINYFCLFSVPKSRMSSI